MEAKQIKKWALRSGFVPAGLNTYEAPYDGITVRLTFGHKFVSSYLVRGAHAQIIVKTRHAHVEVDDSDMIHGVGLNSAFIDRIHHGGAIPCWFPMRHSAMVLQKIEEAYEVTSLPRGLRTPTPQGLHESDIASWATETGFDQIHDGLFEIDFGNVLVSLHILPQSLAAHISDRHGDRCLGEAAFEELYIDGDDILRGVGLKDGFLEHIADGEASPPWFSEELIGTIHRLAALDVKAGR